MSAPSARQYADDFRAALDDLLRSYCGGCRNADAGMACSAHAALWRRLDAMQTSLEGAGAASAGAPPSLENIRKLLTEADAEWLEKEPDDQDAGDYRGFVARYLAERLGARVAAERGAPEVPVSSEKIHRPTVETLLKFQGRGSAAPDPKENT